MRAALILALVITALSAAPALAWQELPFRSLPEHRPATCLQPTGADDGLAAIGPGSRLGTPMDLLGVGAGPPAVRDRARFQLSFSCPVVREQGGAAVAAVADLLDTGGLAVAAAVRDAGGVFARPARLGPATLFDASYDAAVSARGDAVVAWLQNAGGGRRRRARVVAARRLPGGAFGPVEALTRWVRAGDAGSYLTVVAGEDAAGRATVAWTAPARHGQDVAVVTATAAPGAPFGAPQVLTARADTLVRLALAVAPDGGALLAHDGMTRAGLRLFERPPGAPAFGRGRELGSTKPKAFVGTSDPALALRDGGAAVVVWRDGGDDSATRAMTRLPGGSFGPPRTIAVGAAKRGVAVDEVPESAKQHDLGLSAALSADGRAVVAWSAPRRSADLPQAPLAASGTLRNGFGAATVLGSPARAIGNVSALVLAGGEPAAAWGDNATETIGNGRSAGESQERDGRIHVARAGAAARAAAAPPAARIRAPRVQRLSRGQGVRFQVRCVAACDLRAYLPEGDGLTLGRGASLPAAGAHDFTIASVLGPLTKRRPRRVVLRVRVAAPGSTVARTLRVTLRLVRR